MTSVFYWKFAILSVFLWLIFPSDNGATTIKPFSNLAALSARANCVLVLKCESEYTRQQHDITHFGYRLRVTESIKGDYLPNAVVQIEKWERSIGELHRIMFGDIDLDVGRTYLLLCARRPDGILQPICFQYYVLEEMEIEKERVWYPIHKADEFHLKDTLQYEPLTIYKRDELLDHLRGTLSGRDVWDKAKVVSTVETEIKEGNSRAAPGHCTFIGSGNNYRWLSFPDQVLNVHYEASGDDFCANSFNYVQQAINNLSSSYLGINISDGGTFSGFTPICGGSNQGTNLPAFISSQWGDSRHVLVQFNDPCDAIEDLDGCEGVLAVGGLYGSGTHSYDGASWYSGAFGYVVVNNGVGACMCSNETYGLMLTHELTHTLGLGHISSASGAANMNPLCCTNIQSLDEECVDYVYPPNALLPVELVDFSISAQEFTNDIFWVTANESEVEKFVLERSESGSEGFFSSVGELPPQSGQEGLKEYVVSDLEPPGQAYYRLKILNLDGSIEYSSIITVKRSGSSKISLYPSLANDHIYINLYSEIIDLKIFNLTGHQVFSIESKTGNSIDVSDLRSGSYYLWVKTKSGREILRFNKI